jgi:hypothetical protein
MWRRGHSACAHLVACKYGPGFGWLPVVKEAYHTSFLYPEVRCSLTEPQLIDRSGFGCVTSIGGIDIDLNVGDI